MYSNAINKHISDRLSLKNAKWNWAMLSINKNITWEIVKENMDKPWNWYELSCNENITWEIVKENMDSPWDWRCLSTNKDMLLSLDDKKNIVLEHHSASVIQRVWRMVVSNPNYLVCKKRLMYEYRTLENM